MNAKPALTALLALSLEALLAPLTGCTGTITHGGGSGGDGSGGSGGVGGTYGEGGSDAPPCGDFAACDQEAAIAVTWAQLDQWSSAGTGGTTSTGSGGDPGIDPGTEFLIIGSGTQAPICGVPYGNGDCGGWTASIRIGAGLLQPGAVLSFAQEEVDYTFWTSNDEGNGLCSGGGGGGFDQGQVEILEVNDTVVHFAVSGAESFDVPINGERWASRCP